MPDRRILLIEDEPGLVMTLSDRLEAEGYRVKSRSDGEEGLEEAASGGYDLILLDVRLPRRSGLDVCRTLRQRAVSTPILMLTARSQVVDKVDLLSFALSVTTRFTMSGCRVLIHARAESVGQAPPARL